MPRSAANCERYAQHEEADRGAQRVSAASRTNLPTLTREMPAAAKPLGVAPRRVDALVRTRPRQSPTV
jgi:hypothetical protein